MKFQPLFITFLASLASAAPATQPSAAPASVSADPAPKWSSIFHTTEGWIGGDGAYSTQLGPKRIAWFFGDTIIGNVRDGHRVDATMVNNTIAIQTGLDMHATMHFAWSKTADGKAAAMFIPADKTGWFWPQAVAKINGRLYLFLAQIDREPAHPGTFGFKGIGEWLAVIENPADEPEQWRAKQHKLPFLGTDRGMDRTWGAGLMQVGDIVYIYGCDETKKGFGARQLIVARAPADRLADFASWTFASKDGWSKTPSDSLPLAGGMAPEYSVDPLPGGKGYVLVYSENGFSDRILARFADTPRGPWSDAMPLYTSPEMKQDKRVFTYAGKNQAWAQKPGELLVTYCQNMFELGPVFENEWVYRPRFVKVTLQSPKVP